MDGHGLGSEGRDGYGISKEGWVVGYGHKRS